MQLQSICPSAGPPLQSLILISLNTSVVTALSTHPSSSFLPNSSSVTSLSSQLSSLLTPSSFFSSLLYATFLSLSHCHQLQQLLLAAFFWHVDTTMKNACTTDKLGPHTPHTNTHCCSKHKFSLSFCLTHTIQKTVVIMFAHTHTYICVHAQPPHRSSRFCWLGNLVTVLRWWREVAGKHSSTERDTFITHLMIFLHNTTTNDHSLKQTHNTARDAGISGQLKKKKQYRGCYQVRLMNLCHALRDICTKLCAPDCVQSVKKLICVKKIQWGSRLTENDVWEMWFLLFQDDHSHLLCDQ